MSQSALNCRFVFLRWIRSSLKLALLTLFACSACWAQITNVGDTTSTPVPGAGHNYLGVLNETVNPANGSVSVRIATPVPPGRKLTVPFSFAYDSNGTTVLEPTATGLLWAEAVTGGVATGWHNTVPTLTYATVKVPNVNGGLVTCEVAYNYVYTDASGGRHPLYLSIWGNTGGSIDCSTATMPDGTPVVNPQVSNGGDSVVQGYTPAIPADGTFTLQKVWVADADGTVVSFTPAVGQTMVVPDTIEDRNGNVVTVNHTSPPTGFNSYTDTLGRTSVSVSGTNPQTVSVSGVGNYTASYGSVSASGLALTIDQYEGSCPVRDGPGGGSTEITSLTLPNGKAYQFSYDSVSGNISKIVYPTGGYVRYVWGTNSKSEAGEDSGANGTTTFSCAYQYDTPVVTDRYVSFDGSTEVLHQHFTYTTTWESNQDQYSQKTTTVTTYDLVRGGNFQTVYTYSGSTVEAQPSTAENITNQIPVENKIQYYDWAGNGGSLLKTVNKAFQFENENEMTCQSETLGSYTSRIDYAYLSIQQPNAYTRSMALVTDKKEWDWGTAPACGSSTSGTPLRETVTSYNSFTTPLYAGNASIFDKPSQVTVYGSGTQVAQTTYAYTETVSPAGVTTGRDSNYNGNSGIARGNASSVTRWLNTGGSSPVTTYAYDDTGQVTSMTDPLSHITSYSYSNYNAYLASITYPNTGVAHTESFSYNSSTGEVASATNENGKVTSYQYNDPFARLTETDFPDSGKTTLAYSDGGPTPSVTTTKWMSSSQQLVTTAYTDGISHPIESVLSDPSGADYTVTTLDGSGLPWKVTNPYRSTSDPTYGVTTYTYDALGRTTSVFKPDGGTISTVYSGNCTTVTDEAGKNRESCTDGLGRIEEVIENPGGLGYTTNYTYDALDDLGSVVQGGSRSRSFTHDSLGRLLTSANPESATVTYTYDANGNVATKTDARVITTTYSYDALNRVTGMTYSNGDHSVSYAYDQSACLGQPACYNIGHRTTMTDADGSEEFAYDPMGREIAEQRTTNSITKNTSYSYDLAGDMTSLTYPSNRTITYTYDSAGRPSDAVDTANGINYAIGSCANGASSPSTGVCYAPNSSVAQIQNGTNLVSTYIYNDRFQPCWTYATTGNALATSTSCTASESGTPATGTVSIGGSEQEKCSSSGQVPSVGTASPEIGCPRGEFPIYDSGDVSIIVDGFVADASYDAGSSATSIANSLTSQLNANNSPVIATLSGTTITLTSKTTGTSADYTLSTSVSWDTGDFSSPSFTAAPSGPTLTGGSGLGSGNILDLQYNFNLGSGDNGNVDGITNNRDTARSQSFAYGPLNRLTTAQTQGTSGSNCFGFQFTYDEWTNLTGTSILSGYTSCSQTTPYAFSLAVDTNNKITTTGFGYDASGNLSSDGLNNYVYNAESEVKSVAGVTYTYDGDGNRIEKSSGKIYWYGAGTEILDESDTSGNITEEYVFFGGRRVAMRDVSSGNIYYYEADMLGSARTMVQAGQTSVCYDADFLPFGQEVDYTATCGSNYRFEGKERDLETGNDDFGARYYRSALGRWLSADWSSVPAPVPYANLTNPQTLNLYAMVSDNPETFADLDGHDWRDVVFGIGQGLRNFAVDTGAGLRTAVEHPSTIVTGTATSLEVAGHAYFTSAGRSQLAGQFSSMSAQGKTAVITEALTQGVAAALLTKGVGAATKAFSGAGAAETATTTVTHFTSDAGVQSITESGGVLRSGTYVTTPGEIPAGATSGQVESTLELGAGKGANSVTFDTPNSNLAVPENGPTTSGGATQYQLKEPTQIDPTKFKKTEPN